MIKLNPNLKYVWTTKADLKIIKGGRASSKTHDIAGFSIFLASKYCTKFLCIRQFQNKIQESVYAVLKLKIEEAGLEDQFEMLKSTIRHKVTGSEFFFYGINRNITEIKGFEGADICWIEEGEGLTEEQWGVIEPTIRKDGSECWISYNPRMQEDFIETFKHDLDNGILVVQINYDKNPFLSDTMVRKIERMKEKDYEEYEHIYLGIPRQDNEESIIKRSWLEACVDAHKKLNVIPSGQKVVGFDVADDGEDKNALVKRHGQLCEHIEEWKAAEDELNRSAKRVFNYALKDRSRIVYDSIGVGASAGSNFKDFNLATGGSVHNLIYKKFNAGAVVENPDRNYKDTGIKNRDYFENLKAQAWWDIAERCKKTYNAVTKGDDFKESDIISISSDIKLLNQLISELSTPKRDFAKSGKIKVESKDDLKKRKVKSPNVADAFVMSYYNLRSSGVDAMLA
jgi:phage terminase large subunit